MVRKWSYLKKSFLSKEIFSLKKNYFLWRFRFKSFRRAAKIRKKRLMLGIITKFKKKRRYIRKSHYRSPFYFKLFIFKDWSKGYNNSRQFWRFYQIFGSLNTFTTTINCLNAKETFLAFKPSLPLGLMSISFPKLFNAINFIRNKNSIFISKSLTTHGHNFLIIHNDQMTINDSYYHIGSFTPIFDKIFYQNSSFIKNNELTLILMSIYRITLFISLELYKLILKSLIKVIM